MNMVFGREIILAVLAFFLAEVQVATGQCNGLVKVIDLRYGQSAQSGTIYSPGYPNSYEINEDCKWRIVAPFGQKLLIYFTLLDLEYDANCIYDSVKVFDGSSDSYVSKLLTKSCNGLPQPVYSSDRYIYVRFQSDGSSQGEGFVAHYKALNDSSGCPSIDPAATAGVIYSPNFPWNYENGMSCNWTITSPSWKMTYLNFTQFSLESSSSFSCADYVEVRYSYYYRRKSCGSTIPLPISTYSGSVSVTFYSDFSGTYSGFMIFYQVGYRYSTTPSSYTYPRYTVSPTTANPASLYGACTPGSQNRIFVGSSSSSSIASANYLNIYHTSSPGVTCSWEISTANGYILQLTFDKMSISSCSGCSCGYVEVRDGRTSSDPLIGRYCDGNRPSLVSSKGSEMFVKYYGQYRFDSFRATVRSKKAVTVKAEAIVVPIVVAVVLFATIFAVIKCTKITRSAGPAGTSGANEVPLQPLPRSSEISPTPELVPPPSSQSLFPNTQDAPPSYTGTLSTASDPHPFSTDYSPGVPNTAMGDGTVYF